MKNFVIPNLSKATEGDISDYLDSSIESFSFITGLPVTFFNEKDELVREYHSEKKICAIFDSYRKVGSPCQRKLFSSGHFSSRLGEPYIFLCKSGLGNIAMPLITGGTFIGYFIAGPFILGSLREKSISYFNSLNDLKENDMVFVKIFLSNMPTFQPNQINSIALLFYNSVISSVGSASDYDTLKNQYSQQNQINKKIQLSKKTNESQVYPYEMEQLLIKEVIDGNVSSASKNMKCLLDKLSVLESGNLEGTKSKCLWLFAILLRVTSQNNNNLSRVIDIDGDVISRISDAESLDELSSITENIVHLIASNMISSVYDGHSQIVCKALQFINNNYTSKITLNDIANNLHVNSSYFSTLFKNEMGTPFIEYVNTLKVEKACELLVTTNLSIIDIAMSVGFDDQSYFTKLFKKDTSMTPKQYRSANSSDKIEEL